VGISLPAGTHSNGLPSGIQFMGNAFSGIKLLNAARFSWGGGWGKNY